MDLGTVATYVRHEITLSHAVELVTKIVNNDLSTASTNQNISFNPGAIERLERGDSSGAVIAAVKPCGTTELFYISADDVVQNWNHRHNLPWSIFEQAYPTTPEQETTPPTETTQTHRPTTIQDLMNYLEDQETTDTILNTLEIYGVHRNDPVNLHHNTIIDTLRTAFGEPPLPRQCQYLLPLPPRHWGQ